MLTKEKVVGDCIKFILDTDFPIPNSIKEYDSLVKAMSPIGHHRSTLTKNSINMGEVLRSINPDYAVDKNIYGLPLYRDHANSLGLLCTKLDNTPDLLFTRLMKVNVSCNSCGFTEVITAASLIRRSNGCKLCNGSADWKYRETEFNTIALSKKVLPLYETWDTSVLKTKGVDLRCEYCSYIFTVAFNTIVYPKYDAHCPKCRPAPIFGKMGVTTNVGDKIFDSRIEADTYKLLLEKGISIKSHIPYKELGVPNSLLISDFILDDLLVLEVSSFSIKNHPTYHEKVALKEKLLTENTHYKFKFCNSLAEVKKFLELY